MHWSARATCSFAAAAALAISNAAACRALPAARDAPSAATCAYECPDRCPADLAEGTGRDGIYVRLEPRCVCVPPLTDAECLRRTWPRLAIRIENRSPMRMPLMSSSVAQPPLEVVSGPECVGTGGRCETLPSWDIQDVFFSDPRELCVSDFAPVLRDGGAVVSHVDVRHWLLNTLRWRRGCYVVRVTYRPCARIPGMCRCPWGWQVGGAGSASGGRPEENVLAGAPVEGTARDDGADADPCAPGGDEGADVGWTVTSNEAAICVGEDAVR